MDDVDPLSGLRAALLSKQSVQDAVDGRVFVGELPAGESGLMPRKTVVIQPSGGGSLTAGSDADHDTQRIDVLTFGKTPKEAADLQNLLAPIFRKMKREVHAGVLIHWITSAGGFSNARDPDTQWPRAFRSYQIFHALKAAQ